MLARPAANSSGSVELNGRRHDYDVQVVFVPVAPGGLGEPEAAVMAPWRFSARVALQQP
ncbi:MAG: hypothetical protein LH480_09600 [Rubrivivax sp.]|nr:hypothetical protein [Rubrivivax sp.]